MASATQLIRQDHRRVEGLFKKYGQTKGAQGKRRIAQNAMTELEVHAALEEEIFYPAIEKEIDRSMLQEARQEHQKVKQAIAELKKLQDDEEEFDSTFTEMMEDVRHHVEEEENEMLPQVEETELNLSQLGQQMSKRKQQLQKSGGAKKKSTATKSSRKSTGRTKSTSKKKSATKKKRRA